MKNLQGVAATILAGGKILAEARDVDKLIYLESEKF